MPPPFKKFDYGKSTLTTFSKNNNNSIALTLCYCVVADTMKIIHQAHGAKVTLNRSATCGIINYDYISLKTLLWSLHDHSAPFISQKFIKVCLLG